MPDDTLHRPAGGRPVGPVITRPARRGRPLGEPPSPRAGSPRPGDDLPGPANLAATSRSKAGPHIGGGSGNLTQFDKRPRFVKSLDVGALLGIHAQAPEAKIIWRKVLDDQQPYLGTAGGKRLAAAQLAELDAAGARGVVWSVEGLNEVVATGASHVPACDSARAHAASLLSAGKIPIELNIAVGNVEPADVERDNYALARCIQWLWARGCPVGYHGYWDQVGVDAGWPWFAGRYQDITAWLRAARDPASGELIVTAPARWAITEAGYEVTGTPGSGPVWYLIRRGVVTESAAINEYLHAYTRFNADPLVQIVTAFTWWHRFAPEWADYDIAVAPNNQPWAPMLSAYAWHLEQPGLVVDPPLVAIVTASNGLAVRATPSSAGRVLGRLPGGARVEVAAVADGWARLALAAGGVALAGAGDEPDAYAYVTAPDLKFA